MSRTEIDDEEYFATIEKNTNLMILYGRQKWIAPKTEKSVPHLIVVDDTDYSSKSQNVNTGKNFKSSQIQVGSLVTSLQNEPSQMSLLSGTDLEMLSDMDPDSVADMISDRQVFS
ncbi:hypothetical protein TSAR_009968 [Trichomalopsis sarcophagae]|uniref:CIDE-N domain-containing protein n=1 Tax=Trichomalopsis sarcophagae TaxID=543379 RepID=A0A232ERZ2_9HYME|nr:hypothetical protein TSAR_009968 [Trichomalopsis sarcophagae]